VQHAIATKQFADKKLLDKLVKRAGEFAAMPLAEYPKPLEHLTLCTIFFEPSTRTRLSFETAIQNLGGKLITVENAGDFSSAKKGETLEDTIMTINAYADGIVMRHPEVGSADRAAKVSNVPILNAGDGAGEHPSQALLDLYTVQKEHGAIDGLKVGLVGDLLNGRTIHSFIQLLALYKVELYLIAPKQLQLPQKYLDLLKKNGATYTICDNWDEVIGKVDVLYMTRVQKERFKYIEEYNALKDSFILSMDVVKKMKKDAIILHPLPRVSEIEPAVDGDLRARYFAQVKNGLYMRMALLEHLYPN
jgi:aspartate carbamoyltransferase catalytic subunit